MASITVNGNTIDPAATNHRSPHARDSKFILVQGRHVLSIEEKRLLEEKKAYIQEYVAENTYLCRYEPDDLEVLRGFDFIRTVNVYHAHLKTTISLKDMVQRQVDRTKYEVDLILHDNPNVNSAALAPYVADAARVNINELEILPRKIRLTVNQDRIDDLAALDSINRIEEVRPKGLYNDQARSILHIDSQTGSDSRSVTYQGAGQIVCVADTGFDQGVIADTDTIKVHPAFAGRIEKLVSVWPGVGPGDPVGHGTHVCASICGSGVYKDISGARNVVVQGTAPSAKVTVQAMSKYSDDYGDWTLKLPADVSTLFSGAYEMGIRIHTNSWGNTWDSSTGQLGYEADATTVDLFMHSHPEFVILIAAGNDAQQDNHGTSQIGDNSAAKNCITVGATGTTRKNDGWRYKEKDMPAVSGVNATAVFSSRGPTKSTKDSKGQDVIGRIKPDVVAPGVAILSAASRAVVPTARVRTKFGFSKDPDWMFSSGTSMSTPLVAGCVALLREALKQVGKQRPSASLIKALLINGAANSTDPKHPVFDYQQGFGRVDVDASVAMVKQTSFVDGGAGLESTAQDVGALRVDQSTRRIWQSPLLKIPEHSRLVVTLAYPDAQGALLQNDVNLIVRVGVTEKHGNMGDSDQFDHINNVEKIIWNDVPGTTATIVVRANAFTIPTTEQAFAVAWHVRSS